MAAATKAKPAKKVTEAAALKAAKAKADAAAAAKKAPSRWVDSVGVELVKGISVELNGDRLGEVAYRHTHEIEGKPVGMVGVALTGKGDALTVGGRTVRNRSYRADTLTIVVE
jgi:membrane protein involved in colicin uptake